MKTNIGKKKYVVGTRTDRHALEVIAAKFGNLEARTIISYETNLDVYYFVNSDQERRVYVLSGFRDRSYDRSFGYYILYGGYYYPILHKIGAPASIYVDEYCDFFVDGFQYTNTKEYCKACQFDRTKTMEWYIRYGETLPSLIDDL